MSGVERLGSGRSARLFALFGSCTAALGLGIRICSWTVLCSRRRRARDPTPSGWPIALLLACSVRSTPSADGSGTAPLAVAPEPDVGREPVVGDRHCTERCCPTGMSVQEVGSGPSMVPKGGAGRATCLVASHGADQLEAGPGGGVVVAGDGDDTVQGSSLRDTVLGDDGSDEIRGGLGSDHLDGGFGDDRIEGGDNGDLIVGGPGDDTIFGEQAEGTAARPGPDTIHGGPGRDTIDGGAGKDEIFGGVGGDTLRGGDDDDTLIGNQGDDQIEGGEGQDWLSGGAGNDTLRGGPSGDFLHAGIGRDAAYGGDGDDTFVINSECEIEAGEVIDGGPGADRVMSPLTEQELVERGVKLVSIETFTQRWRGPEGLDGRIGSDEVCRFQDPSVEVIEVSGTVIGTDVRWLDEERVLREPDGERHGPWGIVTRYELQVDTVYLGDVTPGQTIPILLAGGTVEMDDGSSTTESACCFTSIRRGGRYRLVLRELRSVAGARSGWEYEWLVESPPNHSMVLRLSDHGPISLASVLPPEGYGPQCPQTPNAGSIASNRKAIAWANTLGNRWDQSVVVCGGAEPCMVAAPPASMDFNMTLPEGCEDPGTFRFAFGDAAGIISGGAVLDGTWGVHPPGVATNPTSLRACDASEEDDGRSCIALNLPRPDLGGASKQRNLGGYNGRTRVQAKATAKSMSWPTLREAYELDITLKHDVPHGDVCDGFVGGFTFSQLVTHELGHTFGLAHVDDECIVNMLESQVARWGAHEQARFRVLYPSHEFEFPDNLYVQQ